MLTIFPLKTQTISPERPYNLFDKIFTVTVLLPRHF
jgi:hypothetical protein